MDNNLISPPKKIAICLFSNDISLIKKQVKSLSPLELDFKIEWWFRHKKQPHLYNSFSQMVNEAIEDTDNEFMVFFNPKSNPTPELVKQMINHLCSGIAFTAPISFGGFGATKELFRTIGMFDERFIHSEYEDNDFMLRLNLANLAHYHNFLNKDYDGLQGEFSNNTIRPVMRGVTKSIFDLKYSSTYGHLNASDVMISEKHKWEEWSYILHPEYVKEKQISPRHSVFNKLISDSWLDKSHSVTGHGPADESKHFQGKFAKVIIGKSKPIEKLTKINIIWNYNSQTQDFRVDVLGEKDVDITFELTHQNTFPLQSQTVKSNRWFSFPLYSMREFKPMLSDYLQVKFYHQGNLLYSSFFPSNIDSKKTNDFIIKSIFRVDN